MWRYTYVMIAIWLFAPELRRVRDLYLGYSNVEILSVLPLLSMVPYVWSIAVQGGWRALPRPISKIAWVWIGAFTYALVLAILNGNAAAGLYTFANFVFPLSFGLWVATSQTSFLTAHRRLTNVLFLFATVMSVYGIIQYIVVPPWDAFWIHSTTAQGALSFGRAEPFAVRVFSTLNSPGPFGNFMALILLLALPELQVKRPALIAQFMLWLVAFGLSLDRSGWVMFMLGAVVYLAGTGKFQRLFAIGAVFAATFVIVPAAIPDNPIVTNIGERLGSLTDLNHDESVSDRQDLYDQSLAHVFDAPFGEGLGLTGNATKLNDQMEYIDSGVLARLIEMGVFGFGLMVTALAMSLSFAWRIVGRASSNGNVARGNMGLISIAIQGAMILLELSGDAHGGLLGLTMWLSLGLIAIPSPERVLAARERELAPMPLRTNPSLG